MLKNTVVIKRLM